MFPLYPHPLPKGQIYKWHVKAGRVRPGWLLEGNVPKRWLRDGGMKGKPCSLNQLKEIYIPSEILSIISCSAYLFAAIE